MIWVEAPSRDNEETRSLSGRSLSGPIRDLFRTRSGNCGTHFGRSDRYRRYLSQIIGCMHYPMRSLTSDSVSTQSSLNSRNVI